MSLGNVTWASIGFTNSEFAQENIQEFRNGLRILTPQSEFSYSSAEMFETIGVLSDCARVSKLAGRQGVFIAVSRYPNKDNELGQKPFDRSGLAFFGS
jgi:hypothetical protein